jgi:hypothetical protein
MDSLTTDIEDIKQLVMRQTNYTYEESTQQLLLHNNDVTKIIRLYLNSGIPIINVEPKPLSINQQIYKEIREMLVDVEKK